MSFHSKLAIGTVQFGLDYGVANIDGRVRPIEASAILQRAKAVGMDTLDTAIAYGDSEVVLGQLGVQGWKTITKLPAVPDACLDIEQWLHNQIQASMTRLCVTRLHGVLLHRPSQLLEHKGPALYVALQALKAQGLVNKIGISVYDTDELEALSDLYPMDLVQAPLNILDRRLVESGWSKVLKNAEVEVHIRSAFLQGLLLMPRHQRPVKFSRWSDIWQEWDRWLCEMDLTPLQACLHYVNSVPDIDRIIVGVDTVAQLNQIIEAADGTLESVPSFIPLADSRLLNPANWNQL
jgi:aryl-alcohol dehydrogenase-like predicted oxidoreductase